MTDGNPGVPAAVIARQFRVDRATPGKWIAKGCPCVRKGQPGRGHATLFDPEAVADWLGRSQPSSEVNAQVILEQLAEILHATLIEDKAALRSGADEADLAAAYLLVFDRACRVFGHAFPFDQLPERICALRRIL